MDSLMKFVGLIALRPSLLFAVLATVTPGGAAPAKEGLPKGGGAAFAAGKMPVRIEIRSTTPSGPWLERIPVLDLAKTKDFKLLKPGFYRLRPEWVGLINPVAHDSWREARRQFLPEPGEPYRFNLAQVRQGGDIRLGAFKDDVWDGEASRNGGGHWFRVAARSERAIPPVGAKQPVPQSRWANFVDLHGDPASPGSTWGYDREIFLGDSGPNMARVTRLCFDEKQGGKPRERWLADVRILEGEFRAADPESEEEAKTFPSEGAKVHWLDAKVAAHIAALSEPMRSFATELNRGPKDAAAAMKKLTTNPDRGLLRVLMVEHGGRFVISMEDLGVDHRTQPLNYQRTVYSWCNISALDPVRYSRGAVTKEEADYMDALIDLIPEMKSGADPIELVDVITGRYGIALFDLNRSGVRLRVERFPTGGVSLTRLSYPKGREREALALLQAELRAVVARAKAKR